MSNGFVLSVSRKRRHGYLSYGKLHLSLRPYNDIEFTEAELPLLTDITNHLNETFVNGHDEEEG
jgi:hypothetical protein